VVGKNGEEEQDEGDGKMGKKMRVLELFSGTESISNVFRERGHECITVDNDGDNFDPTIVYNLLDISISDFLELGKFDMIWASPPCQAFSVASIGTHWTGGNRAYEPATRAAKDSMMLVLGTLEIIDHLKPRYWFIENPRGVLRKLPMMQGIPRKTITYCQYGDTRMKPTDIWGTVDEVEFRPTCKNGDPCHERAPRGAKTGTQGIKGSIDRARIPEEFCRELCIQLENRYA
jgi:hypothetical protein